MRLRPLFFSFLWYVRSEMCFSLFCLEPERTKKKKELRAMWVVSTGSAFPAVWLLLFKTFFFLTTHFSHLLLIPHVLSFFFCGPAYSVPPGGAVADYGRQRGSGATRCPWGGRRGSQRGGQFWLAEGAWAAGCGRAARHEGGRERAANPDRTAAALERLKCMRMIYIYIYIYIMNAKRKDPNCAGFVLPLTL